MIKVRPKIALNLIESFFYEKSIELLHRNTIDTNRLKLSNPLLIIKELTAVCNDLSKNKLKNHDYATSVIKETLKLTKDNHHLKSTVITIDYFNALIERSNKEHYSKIVHAGNLIVHDNKDYINKDKSLYQEIKDIKDDIEITIRELYTNLPQEFISTFFSHSNTKHPRYIMVTDFTDTDDKMSLPI